MVKPIDLDELYLRIGALLRRARIASSRKLTVGSFSMDADEHTARLGDREIPMTTREFSLLYKLLSYPKKHLHARSLWTNLGMPIPLQAPNCRCLYDKAARQVG